MHDLPTTRGLRVVLALVWAGWSLQAQTNLLQNPGFETEREPGQARDWVSSCTGTSTAGRSTAQVPAGSACGFIHKVVDGTSHVAALAQDVAVTGRTQYLLTGLVRGPGNLFSYEYGPNDTWIRCAPGVRGSSAVWRSVSIRFSTDSKAVRSQVRFEIYGKEAQGYAWVDEAYFGPPVPPPETPRELTARMLPGNAAELAWKAPEKGAPAAYLVYRSRFPETTSDEGIVARVTETSWRDEKTPDWPRAYYRVAAIDALHQVGPATPFCQVNPRPAGTAPAAVFWVRPALEKVRRYTPVPDARGPVEMQVELARNEAEWAQLLITAGQDLHGVMVSVTPPRRGDQPLAGCTTDLYRVGYTRVERPTIPGAVPGLYPDPLPPLNGPLDIPVDATQAVWVRVAASTDCAAGAAAAQVTVAVPGQPPVAVPLTIAVFDFALPVAPSFMSAFALWSNFLERASGTKVGTDEYRRLCETYYWFMVDHRMPPDDPPVPVTSPEAARFLDDPRVSSFRIPAGWGKVDVAGLTKTADHLRQHGWLKKGYVYCYDEPTPEQYPIVKELAAQVHSAGRDIPFLMTEQPEEALLGSVDIWCPILSEIKWEAVDARRAAGERLWWYTCCGPQAPYPTFLIDDAAISHRVLSWLQALHRVEGALYWCINVWTPYRDGRYLDELRVWDEAEMFPNANGDGFLIYPGNPVGVEGPVSSMRLETIRDGHEDLEYVALLRQRLAATGLTPDAVEARVRELITPVARTFTDWDHDPAVLQSQRRRVAQAIMDLAR